MPAGVGMLRTDLLLTPKLIDFYKISLFEADEGNPAFEAKLRTWAGYGKINAQKMAETPIPQVIKESEVLV